MRGLADEPVGVAGVRGAEDLGAHGADGLGSSIVDVDGVQPSDAGVVVLGVVPGEEPLAESSGVGDAAEGIRKIGAVLEGTEVRLAVRVVVALTG